VVCCKSGSPELQAPGTRGYFYHLGQFLLDRKNFWRLKWDGPKKGEIWGHPKKPGKEENGWGEYNCVQEFRKIKGENLMKKSYLVLMLALTLVLAPGVGQSAMWVGGQIGGHFMSNTDADVSAAVLTGTVHDLKIEPSVIGGITIGYDFIKEGFLGYAWPDWMKYFGVAVDFTYNRMDLRSQNRDVTVGGVTVSNFPFPKVEGYSAVWTLLFYAHYGFLPDSVCPSGRVHPYVGVGPAVLLSGLNISWLNQSDSSADIALVVEAGVRFFALKNVSLDTSFRYRYAQPSYSYTLAGTPIDIDMNDFNSFSFLFRANYHF
jgi:opacity protein-like surface antigen